MKSIEKMVHALELLRTTIGDLGIQQIIMLLTIFEHDGITQHELCEKLNLKQGTVSKNARRMSVVEINNPKTGEKRLEGMDLIALRPDPQQYRRLACVLTSRGKQVRTLFYRALED